MAATSLARRNRSRSPPQLPPKLPAKRADVGAAVLKAKFATLDGSTMIETTMERSATLQMAQRSLCEAFGKTEGLEAGVVLNGRAFTRGDDTPFEFAPDGVTITVIFKRMKPTLDIRRGF